MLGDLSDLLRNTLEAGLPHLRALSPAKATQPAAPEKWSPQQELGHLIDSAVNNHMRFVLTCLDGEFRRPGYAQDEWVAAHGYQDLLWSDMVELWYRYNSLLAHLIERIPEEKLGNRCIVGTSEMTLGFVISDYIRHMRHHLDHISGVENITSYPAATV